MDAPRAALVLLVLLPAACSRGPAAAPSSAAADPSRPLPSPVPEVVARVNGREIRLQQILPMAKLELDRVSVQDREQRKPEVLRHALQAYVERELFVQEAIARGVEADSRAVDWAYDQMRREHPDDEAWEEFLAGQGMDPNTFRAELRLQRTVSVLLDQEEAREAANAGAAGHRSTREELRAALLEGLRAKARIELFL
jgi:hypothetical protein